MSAKEMFEELGYSLPFGVYGDYHFTYFKTKDKIKIDGKNHYFETHISFDRELEAVDKMVKGVDSHWYGINYITMPEFKAIQKQIEELGWKK